jgi:hypothetical protein
LLLTVLVVILAGYWGWAGECWRAGEPVEEVMAAVLGGSGPWVNIAFAALVSWVCVGVLTVYVAVLSLLIPAVRQHLGRVIYALAWLPWLFWLLGLISVFLLP